MINYFEKGLIQRYKIYIGDAIASYSPSHNTSLTFISVVFDSKILEYIIIEILSSLYI